MTTQHNATFNELIHTTVDAAHRDVALTDTFVSKFAGSTDIPFEYVDGRDNAIFNLGVHEGAVAVLDGLHKAGYSIHDPEGVKVEPAEGSSFSDDYFSRKYWEQVSN